MVECILNLDDIFGSLSDPTRRDILKLIGKSEMTISEITAHFQLTFAAISKHLKVLERSLLIKKRRRGKEQLVSVSAPALSVADSYLQSYQALWEEKLDSLEEYLNKSKE